MDINNMEIFEYARSVPDSAKKQISDGRMKGKTDISPMWRIEKLTEIFGPCGIGWWYVIKNQRLEKGAGETVKAFVDIDLYYKWGNDVSQPIPGIGGNTFVAKERNGLYTDDDAFKKALSDAIGTAAKALGIAADVYMGTEDTKYSTPRYDDGQPPRQNDNPPPPQRQAPPPPQYPTPPQNVVNLPPTAPDGYWYCADCGSIIGRQQLKDGTWASPQQVVALGMKRYGRCVCGECMKRIELKAQ